MTGALLRRLREQYGFTRGDVARAAGQHPCWVVAVENGGKSHSAEAKHNRRQRRNFAAYIAALRALKARRAKR